MNNIENAVIGTINGDNLAINFGSIGGTLRGAGTIIAVANTTIVAKDTILSVGTVTGGIYLANETLIETYTATVSTIG
ncbi:MAG: hypothetical protein QGF23_01100 [Dehalococcoidales bacterium]|nr:hypothetical protein [Dehalococcoidales bacterium]